MERAGLEPIDVGMCSCMQNVLIGHVSAKKEEEDKEKATLGM